MIVEEQIESSQQGVRHDQLTWHAVLSQLAVSSYLEAIRGDVNFFIRDVTKLHDFSTVQISLFSLIKGRKKNVGQ